MTIDSGTDKPGHSLRMLLHLALKTLPDDAVYDLLYDKDPAVATMAARHLQNKKDSGQRTFSEAIKLCKSSQGRHRELGAFILGQLSAPRHPYKKQSLSLLDKLSQDQQSAVRAAAIAALGHLKARSHKQVIINALADDNKGVVQCAVYALWALGLTGTDRVLLKDCGYKTEDAETKRWISEFLDAAESAG